MSCRAGPCKPNPSSHPFFLLLLQALFPGPTQALRLPLAHRWSLLRLSEALGLLALGLVKVLLQVLVLVQVSASQLHALHAFSQRPDLLPPFLRP